MAASRSQWSTTALHPTPSPTVWTSWSRAAWGPTAPSAQRRSSPSARRATRTYPTNTSRRRAIEPGPELRARDPDRRAVAVGRAPDGGVGDDRVVRGGRAPAQRSRVEWHSRHLRRVRDGADRLDWALDRALLARFLHRVRGQSDQRHHADRLCLKGVVERSFGLRIDRGVDPLDLFGTRPRPEPQAEPGIDP